MPDHIEHQIEKKMLRKGDLVKKTQELLFAQGLKFSRPEIAKIELTLREALLECLEQDGYTHYYYAKIGNIKTKSPKTRWVKLRVIEAEKDEENNCVHIHYRPQVSKLPLNDSHENWSSFANDFLTQKFLLRLEEKIEDIHSELPHIQVINIDREKRFATFGGFTNKEELERGEFLLSHYLRYDPAKLVFKYSTKLRESIEDKHNADFTGIVEKQKQRAKERSHVYKSLIREYKQKDEESKAV